MTRRSARLAIILTLLGAGCAREGGQPPPVVSGIQTIDATTAAEVRAILDRYVRAVNDGNHEALRDIWAQLDDVSFVNPLQRLRSWDELQGFWQGFLLKSFTRRDLKPQNVAIRGSGDIAWAVFDWEFKATQTDGKAYQARGWETQIYRKTEQGWRISHVHYSVPITPPATSGQ